MGRYFVSRLSAARLSLAKLIEIRIEAFRANFETNVIGVLKVTRALLPHFRERRSGANVFISSRSGWCGDPFVGPYSGTKFALEGKSTYTNPRQSKCA